MITFIISLIALVVGFVLYERAVEQKSNYKSYERNDECNHSIP